MTVLAVLTVLAFRSGEHLALLLAFCLSYEIQHDEATVAVFLTVSAVMAVSVMMATPLELNPSFQSS